MWHMHVLWYSIFQYLLISLYDTVVQGLTWKQQRKLQQFVRIFDNSMDVHYSLGQGTLRVNAKSHANLSSHDLKFDIFWYCL